MNYGWKKAELSEVCEISSTLVDPRKSDFVNLLHVGAGNMISGTGELIDIKTAQEEGLKSGKFLFDRTMVLYSKIRPYLMKVARPEFDGLCSADVYPLLPKATKLDRDFLFYLLMTKEFTEYAIEGSNRAGMPKVNRDHLFRFATCFPPIDEQKRIVAIVDQAFEAIDVAIENTKQNLANARELFESYLNDVFDRKGQNWVGNQLDKVVELSCTLSYGIVQPGDEYENGLPIVRPTDLTRKIINLNGLKRIDPLLSESYKRTKLSGGELLLCVRGSTGTVGIAENGLKGANVTRGIVPIRFESSLISQAFGYYMFISKMIQAQIKEKTYGTALMQINIGDLRNIVLSYPAVEEQQILVGKLEQMEKQTQRLEAIYRQKLAALTELKQSILQKAFTGELTADQEAP
jgi:type I restriction enzyme, S subunit